MHIDVIATAEECPLREWRVRWLFRVGPYQWITTRACLETHESPRPAADLRNPIDIVPSEA